MDIKELNGELNELRSKFLAKKVNRRTFMQKLAKFGLATPVAMYVANASGIFSLSNAFAAEAEKAISLMMLEPIELQDNSRFKTPPPWRVGFANPGVNNPWRVCFQACVEYQKSLTPEIKEFVQTDAGEKAEKQINDIEDLMGKKLNAIMVNPVTSEALKPIMEKIYDAGIPSVTVDRWVDTDKVTCRTSSEHQDKVGTAVAEYFGKTLNGKGKIAWIKAVEGVPEHDRRNDSFEKTIKAKYPDMEIVTKVVVGSMQASPHKKALSDIVTKYPDIDALFADLAFVGPTYLDVFLEKGMNIPVMNGEDINGWLRLWKKHNVRSIAGSFPVYCGRTGIKAIELILKGEPTPKVWWIPVLVITEQERDKYFRPNFPDGYFATTEVPEKYLIEEYKLLDKFA